MISSSFRNHQLILILLFTLIFAFHSFSIKINMDTTSSSSLTSYYSNVASCSCDLHDSICDNFCCCDSLCSQSQTSAWTSSKVCKNINNNIQTQCSKIQSGDFLSFEDLACVYYSNRGNIGYFYNYPQSGSINYPTPSKFVYVSSNSETIDSISSSAGLDMYSSKEYLMKMNANGNVKYFQVWSSIGEGSCDLGYLNLTQSKSYSCGYNLNDNSCSKSTKHLQGTILLCKNGDCSSSQSLTNVVAASAQGNMCNNFIVSQTIEVTLSSSGGNYVIDSISTSIIVQKNIDMTLNPTYPIKTTIKIKKASTSIEYSGNPGYLLNKIINIQKAAITFPLYNFADLSGNCITTVPNTYTPISILFGQNLIYSCKALNPCSSSYYIDSIAKESQLKIKKWAKSSTDTVSISGIGTSVNTCSSQSIQLNIIYSNAGWKKDMQNYIIGAQIKTKASIQQNWSQKYFKINWIFADPQTIATPVTNYFYSYFQYMWKPLRQYFGVY